jgi:hypothetical protein
MRSNLMQLIDHDYKGYYDSHYPAEDDLIYKQIEAISNLYGRDVEVYNRESAIIPKYVFTTPNGPTHPEPIRLLKEKAKYQYNLLIDTQQDQA